MLSASSTPYHTTASLFPSLLVISKSEEIRGNEKADKLAKKAIKI